MRPLEDAKNPAVFKILSATKLLSIGLYAQTPADERKKSNPRQKLRENHRESGPEVAIAGGCNG
jgi:hypothetical protein